MFVLEFWLWARDLMIPTNKLTWVNMCFLNLDRIGFVDVVIEFSSRAFQYRPVAQSNSWAGLGMPIKAIVCEKNTS